MMRMKSTPIESSVCSIPLFTTVLNNSNRILRIVYAASNRKTAEVERTSYPTAKSTSMTLDPMTIACVTRPSKIPTSSPD